MEEARQPDSLRSDPDDQLFELVQKGDVRSREATNVLFGRYRDRVYGWALRLLGNQDAAADVTQDVFVALIERPERYRGQQRFGAWLYVVTRNRCFNALRAEGSHRHRDLDEHIQNAVRSGDDPSADVEARDLSQKVQAVCASQLDGREQEIIHLRYVWGMKVQEITDVLGLENASGARTYLRNAERKLRQALRKLQAEAQAGEAGS